MLGFISTINYSVLFIIFLMDNNLRGMGDGIEKIRMAEHSGEMSFIWIVPECRGKKTKMHKAFAYDLEDVVSLWSKTDEAFAFFTV